MPTWLITVSRSLPRPALVALLAKAGAEPPESEPVPLGDDELCFAVHGPPDLPVRLAHEPTILDVSPSTRMGLY